jgi:hypothetical protein
MTALWNKASEKEIIIPTIQEEWYSLIYKVSQLLLEQLEFDVYCHWTFVVTAPDKKGISKG